ncbi:MAG: tetratricopeptide repeat protein [Gemmatimonadaceae bacterium]
MPITASKEARTLFLQGRAKAENLEDAGTLFRQAIRKDPTFALAYVYGARTNQEFWKNVEKAVSLADKVSPGEREWILAAKAQAEGNTVSRKEHLDRLLALHPNDPRAHGQMGFYHNSLGDYVAAAQHFTDAVRLDKNYAPAYNSLGYANLSLGKYAEAEQAFKTYIRLIPKNPNPYDSYAELLMRMGRYDESIEQYNKAISLDPTFANA